MGALTPALWAYLFGLVIVVCSGDIFEPGLITTGILNIVLRDGF
jgi:hypothetical protein